MVGWNMMKYTREEGESAISCIEGTNFAVYKAWMDGVLSYYDTIDTGLNQITTIDSRSGILLLNSGDVDKEHSLVFQNSRLIGETSLRSDCPSIDDEICDYPYDDYICKKRSGLTLGVSTRDGKEYPLNDSCHEDNLWNSIHSNALIDTVMEIEEVTFENFIERKSCGFQEYAIMSNDYLGDYVPIHYFTNTHFKDVENEALIYLASPNSEWLEDEKCGEFQCSGPDNVLLIFKETNFSFTSFLFQGISDYSVEEFQIISNNPKTSPFFDDCELKSSWNAYYCENDNIVQLKLKCQDNEEATISQLSITRDDGFDSLINSFINDISASDNIGEYTVSPLPKYGGLIELGKDHNLEFTGTAPYKLWLKTEGGDGEGVSEMRLKYGRTLSVHVYKDGERIEIYNVSPESFVGEECGENVWDPETNSIIFMIDSECEIILKTVNSIMLSIRLEVSVEEYLRSGGPTLFVDRLSDKLNIHPSRIRIVGIRTGSTKLEVQIDAEETTDDINEEETISSTQLQDMNEELLEVMQNLTVALEDNSIDLGAPVLDFDTQLVEAVQITDEAEVPITPIYIPPDTSEEEILQDQSWDQSLGKYTLYIIGAAGFVIFLIVLTLVCKCCRKPKNKVEIMSQISESKEENLDKTGDASFFSGNISGHEGKGVKFVTNNFGRKGNFKQVDVDSPPFYKKEENFTSQITDIEVASPSKKRLNQKANMDTSVTALAKTKHRGENSNFNIEVDESKLEEEMKAEDLDI